ncbi:hypothetical protein P280DRAFT_470744 [Massarina eburnea CBS 473.64]|uniref:Uncharacterized protein n=1 Tax=Massarina eburnea CBS 473.64 TaxID=1395130 RepID=A0A6A6RWH2_9PLEO|nr:hypothetical protein P280DRAFT_470744 [Massarina eburnea CBS 473.64]
MPLRKRTKTTTTGEGAANGCKVEEKKSKRQRLADFFSKSRKQKPREDKHATPIPVPVQQESKQQSPQEPPQDSNVGQSTSAAKSTSSIDVQRAGVEKVEEAPLPTPPPEAQSPPEPQPKEEQKEEPKVDPLSKEHLQSLFSGAPHFFIKHDSDRAIPATSYPWDEELTVRDVSDAVQLPQPAFSAATLHRHLPVPQQSTEPGKKYCGYNLEVVEMPTMLGSQGLDPGTVGFAHFLELPQADNLVTGLQQSQTSNEYLEAMRNKELMQNKPERLGIRKVDMTMVHDRLVELGDLFELFNDSPERMTILNNQSSGDLYANLFGKFLTPPGYDGSTDDPTGIKVQIDTLLKVLRLKGVWYDFSLVEWRIRLGQILWSESVPEPEQETPQLWTEREILLLQITLACELLLRLDAVISMDVDDVKGQMHVSPEDYQGFLKLKTRKTNWDLVLARRFLENILVVKEEDDATPTSEQKPRGFMSILSPNVDKPAATLDTQTDIVLLPQHQARQLSGLLYFAQSIQWPGLDLILADLSQKLGVSERTSELDQQSPYGKFLEPSTPSSISVYATPLASPYPNELLDSYFGHLKKPTLSRDDSRSLQIPLSSSSLTDTDGSGRTFNIGGWLSRSFLTGLILPGEAISHFLMSTLLENDKLAIAALGDSANLYGGFIFSGRTWWSKVSIVGRVLACIDGAVECMGWITFTKLPENQSEGWYATSSERPTSERPHRIAAEEDLVMRDSDIIPGSDDTSVNPTDLTLPRDAASPPVPSVEFKTWKLTGVNVDSSDNDTTSPSETEGLIASVTLSLLGRTTAHTFSLTYDIQFITSWPCTPPASSSLPNMPQIFKRPQMPPLSRTSSRHSTRSGSNRSARHPNIRRNSHGFEPLLSHPPDSPGILPTRMYSPIPDEDGLPSPAPSPRSEPLNAHPLHVSYKYKLIPVTELLDPNFILPFTKNGYTSSAPSVTNSPREDKKDGEMQDNDKTVLILDARASRDLELLARAWCAEKGHHAIIGRTGRTCLACCVREARGLDVNVVIRV